MEGKIKPGKYKGGRPKIQFRSASKETYNIFIKENPELKLTYKQYDMCIREINHQYVLHCLETGNAVKLPYGLGVLAVNRKKGKKTFIDEKGTKHICIAINWNETNKLKRKVYHFNEHTDGYHCNWYWIKSLSKIRIVSMWSFKIAKINSQLLKTYCFDSEKKYYLRYHEYNLKKHFYK